MRAAAACSRPIREIHRFVASSARGIGSSPEWKETPCRTQETEMVDLKPSVEALIDVLRRSDVEFELLPHRRTLDATSEAQVLGVLAQMTAKTGRRAR